MNKVKDYNEFIFDSLLESAGSSGLLPFVFSKEFERMILSIHHPIANDLLNNENRFEPITLIDVTDKNDLVSFSTSPKIIEYLMDVNHKSKEDVMGIDFFTYLKKNNDIWTKYRSILKLGKLVKKLFEDRYPDNGKPGRDIESFVNAYKSVFDKDDIMDLFELVDGEDIPKWYDENKYAEEGRGSELYNSCMNGCYDYLNFYAINKDHVKILILYENDKRKKIVGRALIWYLDEPENRVFMDRIYTIHEYQIDLFKEYAKKNGWLYKSRQSYGNEPIVDTKTSESNYMYLTVKDIKLNKEYPYLDTLRYLNQDEKILSSEKISDIKLLDTNGGVWDSEWSERYNCWINMYHIGENEYVLCELGVDKWDADIEKVFKKEDAVYIPRYGEWISKEKYKTDIVKTTVGTVRDILKKDAVPLKYYGGWAEETYADSIMEYSFIDDDYYNKEDAVYSKKVESPILAENAVKVFTDITRAETDWIPTKWLDKLTYTDKGDYILKK